MNESFLKDTKLIGKFIFYTDNENIDNSKYIQYNEEGKQIRVEIGNYDKNNRLKIKTIIVPNHICKINYKYLDDGRVIELPEGDTSIIEIPKIELFDFGKDNISFIKCKVNYKEKNMSIKIETPYEEGIGILETFKDYQRIRFYSYNHKLFREIYIINNKSLMYDFIYNKGELYISDNRETKLIKFIENNNLLPILSKIPIIYNYNKVDYNQYGMITKIDNINTDFECTNIYHQFCIAKHDMIIPTRVEEMDNNIMIVDIAEGCISDKSLPRVYRRNIYKYIL